MRFRNILSHLGVALSLCVLTITFLEARNPSMGFLTSGWSAAYIALQCIVCIALALSAGGGSGAERHPDSDAGHENERRR